MDLIQLINYIITDILSGGPIFQAIVFPGIVLTLILAVVLVWLERKIAARVQMRIGPLHAGGPGGIFQPIADFVKFATKELIIPEYVDRPMFYLMPIFAFVLAFLPLAFIPLSERFIIVPSNLGMMLVIATAILFPILLLLTGWVSNSKFAFIGGIRGAYQQIAYELLIWFSVLPIAILAHSFNLIDVVNMQAKSTWFIIYQPIGAFVFFIAMLAETGRLPYDLPEAEQEIAAGWYVEYTGTFFALFMASELYVKLYILSLFYSILYLGGWLPSFGSPEIWTLAKAMIIMFLVFILRAAFPRTKIRNFLELAWTKLLPLTVLNLLITLIIIWVGLAPGGA
ncbi:MAG: NADH-quinone oxidoreductase subunit NuoH [Thermoprotei archaeon]